MSMKGASALALALVASLAACEGDEGPDLERFQAALSGNNEVPARSTPATGTAQFTLERDGSVSYTLAVTNLRNVTAAHIHGPAGPDANAGVVVTLFTSSPATPGPVNGELRTGSFTEPDRNAQGATVVPMDSVLTWMRAGRAYVNVHTNDGVAPTNTGPGDFPGGELRGQIMPG